MAGDLIAWIDVVVQEAQHRVVAVTVVAATEPPPSPNQLDWPPHLQHASSTAVRGMLDELPTNRVRTVQFVEASTEEVSVPELALHALAWLGWWAAAEGVSLTSVGLSELAGVVGEGASAPHRLPGLAEAILGWRRIARSGPALGLKVATPKRFESMPYGVPPTPVTLVRARLVGVSVLLRSDVPASLPMSLIPAVRLISELDTLAALATQQPPSAMAIGRSSSVLRAGAPSTAPWMATAGVRVLRALADASDRFQPGGELDAMVRATIGEITGIADARQGDYEACEQVLQAFVDRTDDKSLSPVERALVGDPWAIGTAYLVRARVANHRGDPATGARAARLAATATIAESSVRARILRLEARNLAVVAAQNQWPFVVGSFAQSLLEETGAELEREIETYAPLIGALGDPPDDAHVPLQLGDLVEVTGGHRDPVLGAALGTLGRNFAFLGRHDDATGMLMAARSHLVSPLDRYLSSSFLAHVELDRERVDPARLEATMAGVTPERERSPSAFARRLEQGDVGARFAMNLVLKALALGVPLRGAVVDDWIESLSSVGGLLSKLSAIRIHPTELVARHAAELLVRGGAADRAAPWFELGVAVGREGGPTLQRFARFTEMLARGGRPSSAPRGSVLQPTYEYR